MVLFFDMWDASVIPNKDNIHVQCRLFKSGRDLIFTAGKVNLYSFNHGLLSLNKGRLHGVSMNDPFGLFF